MIANRTKREYSPHYEVADHTTSRLHRFTVFAVPARTLQDATTFTTSCMDYRWVVVHLGYFWDPLGKKIQLLKHDLVDFKHVTYSQVHYLSCLIPHLKLMQQFHISLQPHLMHTFVQRQIFSLIAQHNQYAGGRLNIPNLALQRQAVGDHLVWSPRWWRKSFRYAENRWHHVWWGWRRFLLAMHYDVIPSTVVILEVMVCLLKVKGGRTGGKRQLFQ